MRTSFGQGCRRAALAVHVVLLGCADYGGYNASFGRLDQTPQQIPASIQVSSPQLYKREALINERRDELAYLLQKLKESETITIGSELVRDVELISTLSAQLGLSFDSGIRRQVDQTTKLSDLENEIGTLKLQAQLGQLKRDLELMQAAYASQTTPSAPAGTSASTTTVPTVTAPNLPDLSKLAALVQSLTARLDATSVAPRASTAASSPIDAFQDRQAYRRVLQSAINATSLDDMHDFEGNSLFRMQFRATVLPGDAKVDKSLGILRMQIKRPRLAKDSIEVKTLYKEWLDHVTLRLNEGLHSGTAGANPSLLMMGAAKGVFSVVSIQIPRGGSGAGCTSEISLDGINVPNEKCLVVRIAVPPVGGAAPDTGVLGVGPLGHAPVTMIASTEAQVSGASSKNKSLANTESFRNFSLAMGPAPAWASPSPKQPAVGNRAQPLSLTADDSNCTEGNTIYVQQEQAIRRGSIVPRSTLKFTVSRIADDFANFSPAELNAIYSLIDDKTSCASKIQQTLKELAPQKPVSSEFVVPPGFYAALFDDKATQDAFPARGRTAVYAVTPAELAQRVSTAARAGSAVQIAASLAAILPAQGLGLNSALGYSRAANGKADTLERIPLVVGYSEPGDTDTEADLDKAKQLPGFGWLLGPKVVIDPANQALALEHNLAPYDLTADVVMPGWWPYFDIEYQSEWAPNWLNGKGLATLSGPAKDAAGAEVATNRRTMRVQRRHSRGDLDGIVTLILKHAGEPRVEIASIGRVEPGIVSSCATQVTLLVQGINLWRTQSAYLQGMAAQSTTVLPDMSGVALTFDISKLPQRPGQYTEPRLTLMTPNGWASASIAIDGSRLAEKGCGEEGVARTPPDDGKPVIKSILPDKLYACDTTQRLVIQGKNLEKTSSVYLGGMKANGVAAGTTVIATFDVIGNRGGAQTTLPVILTTDKGVASKDVTIERADCSQSPPKGRKAEVAQKG